MFWLLSLTSIAKIKPQKDNVIREHEKSKHNDNNG